MLNPQNIDKPHGIRNINTPDPVEDDRVLPAGKLQRIIGKASSSWTIDDLIEVVRDRRIRLISLMHVAGDGWLKTLDFVPRDFSHLRDVLRAGERADGSSLFGNMGIQADRSDVVIRPRIDTAFLDPFTPLPTLAILCSHYDRHGSPLPESPDTILRFAYERTLHDTGIDLHALGEVEYFLGKKPDEGDIYGADDRGYHAASPFVFGEPLRREAMAILAEIGVPIKYGHSEVGYIPASESNPLIWEQHELELALLPLPRAAEAVALTAWVLRNLAHQKSMRCSLDPIAMKGHAGSGMHFHMSPVIDGKHLGGENENGDLENPAKWLIAGLTQIGAALMAFGNRSEESFIRLSQGKEAPKFVTWGKYNRKALIRLPVVAMDDEGRTVSHPTVEFRLPDGTTHPHLLLAGIAQGIMHGKSMDNIDDILSKTKFVLDKQDASNITAVPKNREEVADALLKSRDILEAGAVFPEKVIDRVIADLQK
ncbi:MAG: glutamine synthetase beta-grasp domain-containing protein [Candidatus Electryonea clarkiae]|nr:glutamine synthetase beta-grasp domain-containing protein [Candidatus Electryonea clarkiae]MDP8287201.1 glutamine synthetase beta-grasp domain-containing protein [Candidatus Electryonea clarkiae]